MNTNKESGRKTRRDSSTLPHAGLITGGQPDYRQAAVVDSSGRSDRRKALSDIRKLSQTTTDFLDKASGWAARIKAEEWSQEVFCELAEGEIESPIEDLFYIAVKVMCLAAYTTVDPEPFQRPNGKVDCYPGLFITPQFEIGKYRVDFRLLQHNLAPDDVYGPVVVELDGHEFHDKDKHQRSYEKARDRFLTRQGFKVLHFTGSDVVADPLKVAHECLGMVGALVGSDLDGEFDASNPLRLG